MHRSPRLLVPGIVIVLGATFALVAASGAPGRAQTKPSNGLEPTITYVRPIKINTILSADKGSWNGSEPIKYSYQWLRCNQDGVSCTKITNATGTTYTVVGADANHTVRLDVTASNSDGKATARANATNVVPASPDAPSLVSAPKISGQASVGQSLTATTGSWNGSQPISYSFKWQSCVSDMSSCANNGGAGSTYTVAASDSGKRIRVKVQAKNSDGQTPGVSEPTAVVTGSGGGGGGGGGSGIITLPNGEKSIAASAIPKDQRMIVDQVQFTPNPVSSLNEITVKIKVKDTQGYVVRGALVFFRSTPIVTSTPTDAPTGDNGWVTYRIQPRSDFPLRTGYSVQFYVKAYRSSDPTLEGVYGSRLVQVATKTP